INQNPFSAQFDRPGNGRVEIFTKPGTDKIHGQFSVNGNSSLFNAKNPFGPPQGLDYSSQQYNWSFGMPLGKKMSFFISGDRRDNNEDALVHATILDAGFNPIIKDLGVANPRIRTSFNPR